MTGLVVFIIILILGTCFPVFAQFMNDDQAPYLGNSDSEVTPNEIKQGSLLFKNVEQILCLHLS